MYPENPEGTQVIVGSMNMGYMSDTARNRTHNLFRPKWEPIPLGHSDGHTVTMLIQVLSDDFEFRPKARYPSHGSSLPEVEPAWPAFENSTGRAWLNIMNIIPPS